MILEVVAKSLRDVKHAEQYGADRIELCQSMIESGITPNYGMIKASVEAVSIPINVIVRPHNASFVMDEDDIFTMLYDIDMIKKLGANGIVIGPITKEGIVDEEALKRLLDASEGLDVVFHRGFDRVRDQFEALETILKYEQITTILTSGGTNAATDMNSNVKELVKRTKDTHVTIMPGGGIKMETLQGFVADIKPEAIHIGSAIRHNHSFDEDYDEKKIKRALEIIKK